MELSEIRQEIDRIDGQMMELLCRRMDCSRQVAEYKTQHQLPVFSEERERQILDRVRRLGDEKGEGYGSAAALVFSTMMDASRSLQYRQMASGQALRETIKGAKHELLPVGQAKVVCAGVAGAYADEAAGFLFPGLRPRFVETFADVFDCLVSGTADYGVLPIENSSVGSVGEVYDLMIKHRFAIAAAAEVPIRHCLLALPGADPERLKTVYSHKQGLDQCADYITAHRLEARPFTNTAAAAQMVSQSGDSTLCAIASRKAAEIYGLNIIDNNIQTVGENSTRFIVISRELTIPEDANKISLLFTLPHVTGSLYRTLSSFAMAGLNLTKLESRPIRSGGFEYLFYLDFEGSLRDSNTMDLLCVLSEDMPVFSLLGNYREISR